MRRPSRACAPRRVALLGAALLGAASPAAAPPGRSQPSNLEVDGGEDNWHAEQRLPPGLDEPPAGAPVTAVHYRVRNQLDAMVVADTAHR